MMNSNRIAMLRKTLVDDADVLSPEQASELQRAIARLEAADRLMAGPAFEEAKPASVVVDQSAGTPGPLSVRFLTGGKAIFTFSNPTGDRYTFKVTKPEDFRGEFFASVMKGSDNEHDYRYVGMMGLNGPALSLRLTTGSKFSQSSKEVQVLRYAFDIVSGRKRLPAGYKLQHAGKCARCARTLTVPESIETGFGPECAERIGIAA